MIRWAVIVLGVLSLTAFGDDWRATLTSPKPGRFPPLPAQKATYKFGWGKFTAAEAVFDFSKTKGGQVKLTVAAKTIGFVRSLWQMDLRHTAQANAVTLRPISLQQTETYEDRTLLAKVKFEPEQVQRWHESKPAEATPAKWRKFKCADVFDIHTALLFIRSQALAAGDRYRVVVFPARDAYLAELEVGRREKLTVGGKAYDAIKCELRLRGITKKLELEPHRRSKRAFVWVSDDRDRLLLKVEAEIFVGSVWTELESVTRTEP